MVGKEERTGILQVLTLRCSLTEYCILCLLMNRTDLQNLAEERLGDAQALLARNRYGGAYYIVG
jgi:hypothetical protein